MFQYVDILHNHVAFLFALPMLSDGCLLQMLSKTIISALAVLLLADTVNGMMECTYSDRQCECADMFLLIDCVVNIKLPEVFKTAVIFNLALTI